jgi:FMN phosphatase YigB (HAD superfamily)
VPEWVRALPFDERYYLGRYADVASSGIPASAHFQLYGWQEGRNPHPDVDVEAHVAASADRPWEPWQSVYERLVESPKPLGWSARLLAGLPAEAFWPQPAPRASLLPASQLALFDELVNASELVTFDVWDTLLQRRVHPDHVKLVGAQRLKVLVGEALRDVSCWALMERRMAVEGRLALSPTCQACKTADNPHEFTHHEVLFEWVTELNVGEATSLVEDLKATEIQFERESIFLRPDGAQLLRRAGKNGAQLSLVSDTYYTGDTLHDLLAPMFGQLVPVASVVSSCDLDDSKRHGQLLTRLRESHGVVPAKHLHVGDSVDADVLPQQKAGGLSWALQPPGHEFPLTPEVACAAILRHFRADAMELGAGRRAHAVAATHGAAGASLQDFVAACESQLYWDGHALGPALAALLSACDRRAAAAGHDGTVFAISREGALLQEIYEAAAAAGELPSRKVTHLEVSRLSTFLPSLNLQIPDELMRLWGQYSIQSPHQFCSSLALDAASFRAAFESGGFPWDVPVEYPWQNSKFTGVIGVLQPQIEGHIAESRKGLRSYLVHRGFPLTGTAYVIDVGWRGTIQDNLTWATGVAATGTYLGLFTFLNRQPPGHKHGVAFDENLHRAATNRIRRAVSPVERLLTPRLPSTLGYDATGTPIVREDPAVTEGVARALQAFQHGAVEGALDALALFRRTSLEGLEQGVAARHAVDDFLRVPSPSVVALYLTLMHDETFGMGATRRLPDDLNGWDEAQGLLNHLKAAG